MKSVLVLFLAVLIWRDSSGLAVWNQKPAQFWPRDSLFGGQLPRPDVSTNNVRTATSTSGSPQTASDSTSQSADSHNILNPSFCGTVSLQPQLVPSQMGQLNSPVSSSQNGGPSVSLQQGGSSGGLSQYTAQTSGFQGFAGSPQTSGFQNQAFLSSASSQGVPSGSASAFQQHSYDQFISSGQEIPPVPQTQSFRPVLQVVQDIASQASPQGVPSVSALSAQQQSFDQSAGGSSWFVSSGQGVPSSQGQYASVSQTQTRRPVPQVVQGSPFSPQGIESVPASSTQQLGYDSIGGSRWFGLIGQGVSSSQGLNAHVVQGSRPQTQSSQASPQGIGSVSAPSTQQQSNDQSASGSNWVVSSGQGVPSVPQNQTLRPVPQVVQGIASQTQVSQASPQGVQSVSALSAQQQSYDQSAGGSSWFVSSGQGVPSSQGQYAPVSQTQTFRLVPQVNQGSGPWVSPQGVVGVSASPAQQQGYDSVGGSRWFGSLGQGVPSSHGLNTHVVQGSGPQNQGSQASPQGVLSVSALSAQQQSYDQSASGSNWLVSSGQGVSPVPQTQTLIPVAQGSQTSPQGIASVPAPSTQQLSYDSAGGFRWFGSSGQGVPSSHGLNTNVVQGLGPQTQGSQASPQGRASVPAPSAQQQSYDQSASGSNRFSLLGQGVPSSQAQFGAVSQTQTLRPVPQVVQGFQASPQGIASVPALSTQQQSYDQSAVGSSWFGSSGQGVPPSQGPYAPVSQTETLRIVPQVDRGSGPWASPQGVVGVSASPAQQQGYDSAGGSRWFGSLGHDVPSSHGLNTHVVQGSGTQTQSSQASPQGVLSVSAPSAQQQSYDQSASGSNWLVSSGQGVSPVPQTHSPVAQGSQTSPQGIAGVLAPSTQQLSYDSVGGSRWFGSLGQGVPSSHGLNTHVVQGSGPQTQGFQALPQVVASVPVLSAQQQGYDQSAIGSSWFGSSGQVVPSSQGQNAPESQTQTLRLVPQVGSGPLTSPQGVVSVFTPLAQQSYDQSAGGSSWFASSGQGVPLVPQTQTLRPVPQVVQGLASQNQVSQASPQGVVSLSAALSQQQSYDQSAGDSSWFGSSGQGAPSSQGLNAPVVQVSGSQTQGSQASPQGVASVAAPSAQQDLNDQLAGGSSWFLSGQVVPSSHDQNAPVLHTQTLRLVPQVVNGSGPWASHQGVTSPAQQWNYDQAAPWVASQVPGQGQSSSAFQTQLPGPAAGNVASRFTTQGTFSWNNPTQRPSSGSTQFQPSQNAAQVSQASQSSVPKKWFNVMPSGFTPSWSSVSPSAWETANNPYAALSQDAAPSADAMFQSGGLSSSFLPSADFTTNSVAGSSSLSQTSWPPAAVVSSGPISISALPSQNTWQSTGPSQAVLQGSSTVPAASSNLLSSVASRVPISYPGTTSSSNFVPSQASDASVQRVPVNQLNFNTAGTSSGSSVSLPSFTRAVKG